MCFCSSLDTLTAHLSEETEASVQKRSSVHWEYSPAINSAITASFTSVKRTLLREIITTSNTVNISPALFTHTQSKSLSICLYAQTFSVSLLNTHEDRTLNFVLTYNNRRWAAMTVYTVLDNNRHVSTSKDFAISSVWLSVGAGTLLLIS